MDLPQDISYIPNFIEDPRKLYFHLLEENFFLGMEPVVYGGPRIAGLSYYDDRPNSYTEMTNTDRSSLNKRLWLPATGLLAGQVAAHTGVQPTVAVCNFYRDGEDFLYPHSDYDYAIGPHVNDAAIAIVSFGVERLFQLMRIDQTAEYSLILDPGSLLVMRGETQKHWLHAVPKTDQVGARLSVTFLHHQLDPFEQRSWVLTKVPDEFFSQIKDNVSIGQLMRNYTGPQPVPVFIGSQEEVFSRWCCMEDLDRYVALKPGPKTYEDFMNIFDLFCAYPELGEHIPKDSNFNPPPPPKVPTGFSPNPDSIELERFDTAFLEEMNQRVATELARRAFEDDGSDPS